MPNLSPSEILEAAIEQSEGIVLTHDDTDALRRRLYIALRQAREARDDRFLHLEVLEGRIRGELIVRPKPPDAEETPG